MFNFLLNANEVFFPSQGGGWFPWIGEACYGLISWIHNNGAIGYGVAIILFTILLKLILSPLDFATKYFTKKNANFMQKIKPEEDELRQQYCNEPQKLMLARQQLYRKHGYKMGGFMLFMILNLFVTMAVFFSVFGALNSVASHNVNLMSQNLQNAYVLHYENGTLEEGTLEGRTFAEDINQIYRDHTIGFLWVDNIWKSDTPTNSALTFGEFNRGVREHTTQETAQAQYNHIMANLDSDQTRSWNGLFLLIALAGITAWASAHIASKVMAKKKSDEDNKPKEEKVYHSMRDAKNQNDQQLPTVDPVMMGKIMKIILPTIMVFFTLSATSALAIYIIMSSIMSTIITMGMGYPVDKLLAWQEKRKAANGDGPDSYDPQTINPHAKYFKTKGRAK